MSHHAKLQNLSNASSRAHPHDERECLTDSSLTDSSLTDSGLTDSERAVLAALRDIAYGQVEVVVHSSRIVQITRSQKLRVDGDRPDNR